jgi:hypothetical protein
LKESVKCSDIWTYSFWTRLKCGVKPPRIESEQTAKVNKQRYRDNLNLNCFRGHWMRVRFGAYVTFLSMSRTLKGLSFSCLHESVSFNDIWAWDLWPSLKGEVITPHWKVNSSLKWIINVIDIGWILLIFRGHCITVRIVQSSHMYVWASL